MLVPYAGGNSSSELTRVLGDGTDVRVVVALSSTGVETVETGFAEETGSGFNAGLDAGLPTGVPGCPGLGMGELGFEIQMPSTWTPLSKARAPNGMSSLVSMGYRTASSSFWRASAAANFFLSHLVYARTQKAYMSTMVCSSSQWFCA